MSRFFARTAACLALLISASAYAQESAKEPPRLGGPEANIKRVLESRMRPGTVIDGVTRTPFFGLFEVRVGGEVIYTDERVTYLFHGNVLDGKTMENLTQERIDKLSAIRFDDLPLASSIRQVNGSGKRRLAYFADPNCGYCKKFERETLARIPDTTIHIFLYPILSPDSVAKSKAVWCSADKLKSWNDWMMKGQVPSSPGTCDNPIESLQALGQKMRVNATPTIFLSNGRRIPGAISLAQLEAAVNEAAK
jgi:thiol:disulfide interchange protein DsbC